MYVQKENEKINYDKEHDVLYIFIGPPRMAYEDEVSPGIFLRKDDDTDEVIGAIIMGYRKIDIDHLINVIPFQIDFKRINEQFIN
ncbi:Protein of unknown function [Parageobacillus thermantarcticus]|uniref:DUF2283 domain-containing protein n=1 Tax=Parageobacillus thermantarcticus TaxID=186116 RepID=A0A1I0TZ12_9BACL|nr:DUF2283 domain-containing protein [Parageobacillus thermantarcticus]SFA56116.1 Protein of unknown function [Parageobacillus thermantarcticus]